MYSILNGSALELSIPAARSRLMGEIRWGAFDELLTPAYWKGQAWQHEVLGTYSRCRLGRSLTEEVAACLLGGYGMRAELALAAFWRLRDRGLLSVGASAAALERALAQPFATPNGETRLYRFPRQKARYLSVSLNMLKQLDPPRSDVALRDSLLGLPGVGPKTASWIVRNHRASDDVAIIDIHVLRAGRHLGLFPKKWTPQRHYSQLESAFLEFARAIGVRCSLLDALIWNYMRCLGPLTR